MAIIAIVSGSYCFGDEVVNRLAEKLDYRNLEATLLDAAAQEHDVRREKLVRALTSPDPITGKSARERVKHLACIGDSLAELIQADNAILSGCASYLLPGNISHVLKVCLIAKHSFRLEQAMKSDGLSESEAETMIQVYDKALSACANYLHMKPAYDESLFDMVVPMDKTSVDEAVESVYRQSLSDAVRTTDRSREAATDFRLSARIKMTLTEAGHDVDVVAESGQVVIGINEQVLRMGKLEEKLKRLASAVPGVEQVETKLGRRYSPRSLNPWESIEAPPKILLVDDEKDFVHTLSERLQTRSLESSIAYDGEQALEMVESDLPDVIVLDLKMPGIDGIETLRRVKASHPEVEVIILTGHGSEGEQRTAEELGVFAYLHKPVNINELAQIMKEAYARRKRKR